MRLRLLLPRGRRGAGLGGLSVRRRLTFGGAQAISYKGPVTALAALALAGCGAARPGPPRFGATPTRPAFGITEDNAQLLWSPQAPPATVSAGFGPSPVAAFVRARRLLSALHPAYVRLLIDWAALQPDADRPPDLEGVRSGCARGVGPCAPYLGVRDELAAIASQQRAGGGFAAVIQIYGTPAWAAAPPSGCESGSLGAFSRAPSTAGLAGYRALIGDLVALGEREGVALDWWSPWNEPNDPTFLSPQRYACSAAAPPLAPSAYARLAQAMAAQLGQEGGQRHMLLGELNAYEEGAPDRLNPAQFIAALPAQALCLSSTWAIHAYAARGPFAPAQDPVGALERALDERGGCAAAASIWVTEAGAGAAHPGDARSARAGEVLAGCAALARQLAKWSADPRVGAVFQYTFREDPAFPVGLLDPAMARAYAAYGLWLSYARAWAEGQAPPRPAAACAPAPAA